MKLGHFIPIAEAVGGTKDGRDKRGSHHSSRTGADDTSLPRLYQHHLGFHMDHLDIYVVQLK